MRPIAPSTTVSFAAIALFLSLTSEALTQHFVPEPIPSSPHITAPTKQCCGQQIPSAIAPQYHDSRVIYYPQNFYQPQLPTYYGQPIPSQRVYPETIIPAPPSSSRSYPVAQPTIQPTPQTIAPVTQQPTAFDPEATVRSIVTAPEQATHDVAAPTSTVREESQSPVERVAETVTETNEHEPEQFISNEDVTVDDYVEDVVEKATETITADIETSEEEISDEDAFGIAQFPTTETTTDEIAEFKQPAEETEGSFLPPAAIETETATVEEHEIDTTPTSEFAQEEEAQEQAAQHVPTRVRPKRESVSTAKPRRIVPAATPVVSQTSKKAEVKTKAKSPAIVTRNTQSHSSGWSWWMAAPLALLPLGWLAFKRSNRKTASIAADTNLGNDRSATAFAGSSEAKRYETEPFTTTQAKTPPVVAATSDTARAAEVETEFSQQNVVTGRKQTITPTPPTHEVNRSTIASPDPVQPVTAKATAATTSPGVNATPAARTATQKPVSSATQAPKHNETKAPAVTASVETQRSGVTAAAAAAVPAGVTAATTSKRDDFTVLEGVTPELQQSLYAAGFSRYADLEKAEPATIQRIFTKSLPNGSKFQAESWLKQASFAARGDRSGLTAATTSKRDDFTILEGVTPELQQSLYAAGFSRYADLEKAEPATIQRIFAKSLPNGSKFQAESWLKQASFAARGDWSGLTQQIKGQQQPATDRQDTTGISTASRPTSFATVSSSSHNVVQSQEARDTASFVGTPSNAQDDLTRIHGIGPATVKLLNAAGIGSYAQLASMNSSDLKQILSRGGASFRSVDPTTWSVQAKHALEGDWSWIEELKSSPEEHLLADANSILSETSQGHQRNFGASGDLTQIRGIAPATAGVLNAIGIRSIADLAQADLSLIQTTLGGYGTRFQNAAPSEWLQQARELTGTAAAKTNR